MRAPICEFSRLSNNIQATTQLGISRILLDDVLAAVDSHVARHVFGEYMHLLAKFIVDAYCRNKIES